MRVEKLNAPSKWGEVRSVLQEPEGAFTPAKGEGADADFAGANPPNYRFFRCRRIYSPSPISPNGAFIFLIPAKKNSPQARLCLVMQGERNRSPGSEEQFAQQRGQGEFRAQDPLPQGKTLKAV